MKKQKLNITEELLVDYCMQECDQSQVKLLDKEVELNPEIAAIARQVKELVCLEKQIDELREVDVEQAYKNLKTQIFPEQYKQSRLIVLAKYMNRYAAVLLIPFFISTLLFAFLYFSHTSQPITFAEIQTTSGMTARYELSDGSVVWLNGNSKLRYPTRFAGKNREVELWGEGYFEVKADLNHPFYVRTDNGARVYAYGTKFNVSSYGDDDYIETVLEKGNVNMIAPNGLHSIILKPGEKGVLERSNNTLAVRETNIYENTAWREGKMVFRSVPLELVLKRLERKYNVVIHLNNTTGKTYLYRATFSDENLYEILEYLKLTAPIEYNVSSSVQKADSTFSKKIIEVLLKE